MAAFLRKKYPTRFSCMMGKRNDEPLCSHIGTFSVGKKLSVNDPSKYIEDNIDINKKYDSRLFQTEYKD